MENYTDNELKEELARRGYCTTALWHIDDIRSAVDRINENYATDHTMGDSECMEILDGLFGENADLSPNIDMLEYAVFEHLQDRRDMSQAPRSRGR
ncbi:hypothetical protein [Sphingobacterium spiritivorum]|uniref:hypothetical protein n=1 Tax=Sphingobacterium spiritivorum TaxID=258 RepID=UPI003DA1D90E